MNRLGSKKCQMRMSQSITKAQDELGGRQRSTKTRCFRRRRAKDLVSVVQASNLRQSPNGEEDRQSSLEWRHGQHLPDTRCRRRDFRHSRGPDTQGGRTIPKAWSTTAQMSVRTMTALPRQQLLHSREAVNLHDNHQELASRVGDDVRNAIGSVHSVLDAMALASSAPTS